MSNDSNSQGHDDMRSEYDFSKGVRGKYAQPFAEGTNLVALEPDVAEAFPTSESVNNALRSVLRNKPGKESA